MKSTNQKYSRFLRISGLSFIVFNILLAVFIPFLLSINKEFFTFLFILQRAVFIPLTSLVLILWLIDYWTNISRNKQKPKSEETEKKEYNLIGRLSALGIGTVFLLIYIVYEAFSKPYSGPYMSDTLFILMIVVIVLAIILGPLIGQIYKRIKLTRNIKKTKF